MSEEDWAYNSNNINNIAVESDDYYRVGMEYIDLENVIGSNQGQVGLAEAMGDSMEQGMSNAATEGFAV